MTVMVANYPLCHTDDSTCPEDSCAVYLDSLKRVYGPVVGPVTKELLHEVGRTTVTYEVALENAQFPPELKLAAAQYRGPASSQFSPNMSFSEAVESSQVF
jgi:hypothetical protein